MGNSEQITQGERSQGGLRWGKSFLSIKLQNRRSSRMAWLRLAQPSHASHGRSDVQRRRVGIGPTRTPCQRGVQSWSICDRRKEILPSDGLDLSEDIKGNVVLELLPSRASLPSLSTVAKA